MRVRHRNIVLAGIALAAWALGAVPSCGSSGDDPPPPSDTDGGCGAASCADVAVADAKTEHLDAHRDVPVDSAIVDAPTDGSDVQSDAPVDTAVTDAETDGSDVQGDAPIDTASSVDACADGGCATCALGAGLVGHWKLDDGAGTVAVDSSGSGNHGTLMNAPTWTTAAPTPYPNTAALSFDGVSSFVTMGNPAALRITGPLTVACWFKTSLPLDAYRTLVSKWWSGEVDAAYSLHFSSAGLHFGLFNGAINLSTTVNLVANDGTWHAVVGTWDGTTARTYVDGVLRDSVTNAAFGALADIAHPVNIGTDDRYPPGSGRRRSLPARSP